jgi:hypothetical protein
VTYRSTFIYLMVVLLFLGFFLFETRRDEKKERAQETMKALFSFQTEALTRLSFRTDNQEIVAEKNQDGEWEITAPLHAPADPFALSRVKNTLGGLQYLRIISKDPRDLSEFGLDPPSFVITYHTGDEEGSLAFGHKSPVEDGFYARRGADRTVYLIWRPDKSDLEKTLFDLRYKSLFTLRTDQVERLAIERSGQRWILNQRENTWFLIGQEHLVVNQVKLVDLLHITMAAEALSFVLEDADDLAPYGLDQPQARVTVSGAGQTEEILYGAPLEERAVYAMIAGKPQILAVPRRLLDDLPKTLEALTAEENGEPKS